MANQRIMDTRSEEAKRLGTRSKRVNRGGRSHAAPRFPLDGIDEAPTFDQGAKALALTRYGLVGIASLPSWQSGNGNHARIAAAGSGGVKGRGATLDQDISTAASRRLDHPALKRSLPSKAGTDPSMPFARLPAAQ